jgi:hypothetical protein
MEKVRVLKGGMLFIRGEGEKPFSMDLKVLRIGVQEPLGWRMRDAYHHALPGGALHSAAPSEPDGSNHRLVPERSSGLVRCGLLPCSVPFR